VKIRKLKKGPERRLACEGTKKDPTPQMRKGEKIWRSVADEFDQFPLLLSTLNHISYKELQAFSFQVKVSKPNQKLMLYTNCTPKEMKQIIDYLTHIMQRLILKCNE